MKARIEAPHFREGSIHILVRCDRMENTLVDGQLPPVSDVLHRVVIRGEGAP